MAEEVERITSSTSKRIIGFWGWGWGWICSWICSWFWFLINFFFCVFIWHHGIKRLLSKYYLGGVFLGIEYQNGREMSNKFGGKSGKNKGNIWEKIFSKKFFKKNFKVKKKFFKKIFKKNFFRFGIQPSIYIFKVVLKGWNVN